MRAAEGDDGVNTVGFNAIIYCWFFLDVFDVSKQVLGVSYWGVEGSASDFFWARRGGLR